MFFIKKIKNIKKRYYPFELKLFDRRINLSSTGFSLPEILVVAMLGVMLAVPGYRIFRGSSQASLQGIQQLDMVSEGRMIIRLLHNDLKTACIALSEKDTQYSFVDYVKATGVGGTSIAGTVYKFLSFSSHVSPDDAASARSTSGLGIKCANEISYSIKQSEKPDMPFYILTRTEKVHPKLGGETKERILSRRVNFFSIQAVELQTTEGKNQWFFNITLQLAEARNPANLKNLSKNGPVLNMQSGMMITDFFDVVCPTMFASMWNRNYANRNWHTLIQAP
ncbi:MAG: hypothetical protein HQM10_07580 [Candidatus Riflebacteria bacterium]|nr:hypothetical protein [Candidatus Riflebacteria bacterium]